MTAATPINIHKDLGVVTRESDEDLLDLSNLARALWQRKLWLLSAACIGALLALLWTVHVATPIYQATTVLVMEPAPEPSLELDAVVPGLGAENSAVNTEIEILSSRSILGAVVDNLNLTSDPEFNPKLASGTFDAIKLQLTGFGLWPVPSANEPALVSALTRTATMDQLAGRITIRNVPDSMVFEITVESPDRKKAAQLANEIADVYILRQIELKFNSNDLALNWMTEKAQGLSLDLERKETAAGQFAAQMQIINPDTMEALSFALAELRQRIAVLETARSRNALSSSNAAQLSDLRREEQNISDRILQQSQNVVALAQLQREAEASRLVYESFVARLKETSVQKGVEQADSAILSRAEVAEVPAQPQPILSALAGGFAGIFLLAFTILRRETTRDTFRTAEELMMQAQLPITGQIRKGPARRTRKLLEQARNVPNGLMLEDIRNLRTTLLAQGRSKARTILVTSSLPKEGKTTQTALLAEAFAELGRKVLVVDADLRRPSIAGLYGLEKSVAGRGFPDVLTGDTAIKDAIIKPKSAGFWVLATAPGAHQPTTLLSNAKVPRVFNDVAKVFDIVLIDSPPLLAAPDARIIAGNVDDVVVAVQWNKTRASQLARSLDALRSVGVTPSGLILTQINARTMRAMGAAEYQLKPY